VSARFPRSRWAHGGIVLLLLAGSLLLLWWRGPDWESIADAFTVVHWWWIVAALALNLGSVVARAAAWRTVVKQALPAPCPPFQRVFSAFSVGLLANAVLPGRVGELARVAVLTRGQPRGRGDTARLLGTVFAHRVFDVIPSLLLVAYVLLTAKIPDWAIVSLAVVASLGGVFFAVAIVGARINVRAAPDIVGPFRRLLRMAKQGLEVMNAPLAAGLAVFFQCVGWFLQLVAVYLAMRAFGIHAPLPAAGLVLLLMNVATFFPLWPGNIALPLVSYGVAYARGFAYGLGLQVIEMSVGVGVGFVFLAREGLSLGTLRRMPSAAEADVAGDTAAVAVEQERARARVPG
jgi:glycosyltransferase 2 family protein